MYLFLFLIIVVLLVIINASVKEVVYCKSDIDGKMYLVRDLHDKKAAANMLARLKSNIRKLVDHMSEKKHLKEYDKYRDYVKRLEDKTYDIYITESGENSIYTSYTVNKGDQIVFCLRSKQIKNKMHDINLVMYVLLHEISHIACPETGHTPLFNDIFSFIASAAVEAGMYTKIDFEQDPHEYCGMKIKTHIPMN